MQCGCPDMCSVAQSMGTLLCCLAATVLCRILALDAGGISHMGLECVAFSNLLFVACWWEHV